MPHFVYILASRPGGALYVGLANDLRMRLDQHRSGAVAGHTARYNIRTLVWFEMHEGFGAAAERERRIKRWRRRWKEELIMSVNPWRDLASEIPL